MKTQGKITIVHIGPGRTNPNVRAQTPNIIIPLVCAAGFDGEPPDAHDAKLNAQNQKNEDKWRLVMGGEIHV